MIRSKQQQSAQQNMRKSVGVIRFNRLYETAFKIQVLDSYWHDKDCRQNQRATARKYGIHLSQMQRWLQCEEKLRNSLKKENYTRRFFDTAFKIKVLDSYRHDKDCRQDQKSTARKYGIDCRHVQRWLQCEEKLRSSVKNGDEGQAVSPATASPASVPKSESNATEVTGSTVTSATPALNLNLNLAGQHGDELTTQQGPPQSMIKTERASSDIADSGNSPSSVRHVDCSVHLVDCTRAPTSSSASSPYLHVHAHERAHTCSPLDPEKPIPSLLHEQKIESKESEESEEMQAECCRTLIKEEVNLDEEEACNEGEEVTASSCFDYQQYKRPPVGGSSPSSSGPVSPMNDRYGHFTPLSPRDSPSAERSRNSCSDSEMEPLNDLEIDARIARWQTALNRVRQYRRWESERERSVKLLAILERYVSKLPKLTPRDLMMMEEDRRQNLKAIDEIEACEREAFGRHVSRVNSVKVHDPIDGHEIADVKMIISTNLHPRRLNGAHRPFRVTLDFRDDEIFADAAVTRDEQKIEKSSEVASDNEEVATSRSFASTGGVQSEATASGERESRDLLQQLADLRDDKGVSDTTDGQRRETRECPLANRTAVPSRKAPEQSSTPADSTTRLESMRNPESSEPESDVTLTRKDTYRVRFMRDEGEWIATAEAAGERRAAKTAKLRNREIYEEELVEYRDRRAAARLKSRKSSTARSSHAAELTGRAQSTAALASPQATSTRDGAGARDVGRRRTNRPYRGASNSSAGKKL